MCVFSKTCLVTEAFFLNVLPRFPLTAHSADFLLYFRAAGDHPLTPEDVFPFFVSITVPEGWTRWPRF